MTYNKAREEKRWIQKKQSEEKLLRELGMDEEAIQELRHLDWEIYNSERRYREHQATFLKDFIFQSSESKVSDITNVQTLLNTIDDERILHTLLEADKSTLQIILLRMVGFSVKEISTKIDMPKQTIYTKIGRLRKKMKNFKKVE